MRACIVIVWSWCLLLSPFWRACCFTVVVSGSSFRTPALSVSPACAAMALPTASPSSREWTDYVLQLSTGPGGLLKHLHGVFLYPDTWSQHPKYRSRGGKSKVYVTHSILRGAPWEEEGWTMCERHRGEQSQTMVLARLTGCTAWPTAMTACAGPSF